MVTRSKNFYLIIFNALKAGKNPATIAKELGTTKQQLNYYLSTLKSNGIIRKIGYGTWEILKDLDLKQVKKTTQVGRDNIGFTSIQENKTRGHAFMFILKLPGVYRNWEKREKIFDQKGIKYKKLHNLGKGQKIIYKGRIVHLKSKSIIIYERASYIADLASEAKSKAIYELLKTIRGLERLLSANFQIRGEYQFKVSREHYSLIKNCMAKQYNEEGKKLMISNKNGLWMAIDNSYNLNELENFKNREIDPQQAVSDSEGIRNYFNEHKDTKFQVTPKFVLNTMNGIQQNQQIFAQNIATHIKAIQDLGESSKQLGKGVKELTKLIKELKHA